MPIFPTHRGAAARLAVLALAGLAVPCHAQPSPWRAVEGAATVDRPEKRTLILEYLHYRDSQPGLDRLTVSSPSVLLRVPLVPDLSLLTSLLVDDVSGVAPQWQSVASRASARNERRSAGELSITRHLDRSAYSVGVGRSSERAYLSTSVSLGGSWASADEHTTWSIGVRSLEDVVQSRADFVSRDERQNRRSTEMLIELAQRLTAADRLQIRLNLAAGEGSFSDPYKLFDARPEARKQVEAVARWIHALPAGGSPAPPAPTTSAPPTGGARLDGAYRLYRDSDGVRGHAVQLEWLHPLDDRLTLAPLLRYHTQGAARFYVAPVLGPDGQVVVPVAAPAGASSGDPRLSAFGAFTLGLTANCRLAPDWTVDARLEWTEQRGDWKLGGQGTQGVDALRAGVLRVGVQHRF